MDPVKLTYKTSWSSPSEVLDGVASVCLVCMQPGRTKRACGSRWRALIMFKYQLSPFINWPDLEYQCLVTCSISLAVEWLTNLALRYQCKPWKGYRAPSQYGYKVYGPRGAFRLLAPVCQSEVLLSVFRLLLCWVDHSVRGVLGETLYISMIWLSCSISVSSSHTVLREYGHLHKSSLT